VSEQEQHALPVPDLVAHAADQSRRASPTVATWARPARHHVGGLGLNFPIMKHLLTEWPPLSSRGLCGIVGAAAFALRSWK
jgi:hypothetical protein